MKIRKYLPWSVVLVVYGLLAVVVVLKFTTANAASTPSETTVTVHEIYNAERSARVVTTEAKTFMCLVTSQGQGFSGSDKWAGLTCAQMGVIPITWQFCKGLMDQPILLCVSPETVLQDNKEQTHPGSYIKTGGKGNGKSKGDHNGDGHADNGKGKGHGNGKDGTNSGNPPDGNNGDGSSGSSGAGNNTGSGSNNGSNSSSAPGNGGEGGKESGLACFSWESSC